MIELVFQDEATWYSLNSFVVTEKDKLLIKEFFTMLV